jgi:hypothetical protein
VPFVVKFYHEGHKAPLNWQGTKLTKKKSISMAWYSIDAENGYEIVLCTLGETLAILYDE